MKIDEGYYLIYGNVEDPAEERPLNVFVNRDDEDVVVGRQNDKRVFKAIFHADRGSYSFKLHDFNLFIGFDSDQQTNILKLARSEVQWEVVPIEDEDAYEVYINDGSTYYFWDMNSDVFASTIRLSPGQPSSPSQSAPRPPKQKWKFVRIETEV